MISLGSPNRIATDSLVRGDTDNHGTREITDAIHLLGHLFLGGPAPPPLSNADFSACVVDPAAIGRGWKGVARRIRVEGHAAEVVAGRR